MQTTNIFVARHGETEYNRTHRIQGRGINEPLNDTGRRQASAIARSLGNAQVQYVYASSLKRSVQTADIIAEQLGLSVESHPELDEMNFGVIEGKPIDEIRDDLDRLHTKWSSGETSFALEKGESPETVLERVTKRTDLLIEQHRGENMVLVLHGRLIRILLSHWLGYGLQQMHRVEHQNGALYHLRKNGDEKMESVFLNKIDHLEASNF